jgi:hypothetical protein
MPRLESKKICISIVQKNIFQQSHFFQNPSIFGCQKVIKVAVFWRPFPGKLLNQVLLFYQIRLKPAIFSLRLAGKHLFCWQLASMV